MILAFAPTEKKVGTAMTRIRSSRILWLRTSGRTAAAGMIGALLGSIGLTVATPPPALAATGGGSATGTSQTAGGFSHFPPPCAYTTTLTYEATGSATYTATAGHRSATYSGPVALSLAKTAAIGYGGPFGTHGYLSTCKNPAGTPFYVTATTTGSDSSGSVSCAYTGTLSRVNPKLGNGTDLATAVLQGTCTVRQGSVVVSDSPTMEQRTMNYILNSCTGGPAPNFDCSENTTFTASNLVTGPESTPLVIGPGLTTIIGATIDGPVEIEPGASVSITGSQIDGSLRADGAASLKVCGTMVAGSMVVRGASGPVTIGDAGDDTGPACASNTITGSLTLSGNTGGVEVGGDTINGAVRLDANTGSATASETSGGTGASLEVEANNVGRSLVCSADAPAPTDDGQPNVVSGLAVDQCAGIA